MLVLLNPHKNHLYGKIQQRIDMGLKNISKLEIFLQSFIMATNTGYLVDKEFFPETPKSLKFFFKSKFFQTKLLKEWEHLNKIHTQKPIISWDKLTDKDTIILSAKDLKYKKIEKKLKKTNVRKLIIHSNHYYTNPDIQYKALSNFQGKFHLISEVSMRFKPLVKDFLPMIEAEHSFGYCVNKKFKCYENFMNRKERAITFGTINLDLPRNIALRKHLNNNGLLISQYYRTQLYNYSKDSKIIDSFFNVRHVSKISKKEDQKLTQNYHNYDLNELLNSYKLALLVPDSLKITPQAFFEAMACGVVVVTMEDKGLEEMGIFKGVHYVAFDFENNLNNLDTFLQNLLTKKNYMQKIHEEALKISKNFRKENISYKLKNFLENF